MHCRLAGACRLSAQGSRFHLPTTPSPRAAALCGRMMSDFGGVDRFAQLWKAHIDHAASVQPGSARVLRALGAIVRIIEVSTRQQRDCSQMTDEDLEAEFERLLAGIGK